MFAITWGARLILILKLIGVAATSTFFQLIWLKKLNIKAVGNFIKIFLLKNHFFILLAR